jgi:hypothetical protein
MPDHIDRARQLIESRLADLDAEAESLERALASLLGEGAGAKRRPGRPRKRASVAAAPPQPKPARRKRKSSKRARRGQRREQFLAAVKKSPGAKVSEIARELGISANQTHTLAGRLHQQKVIRKSGMGYRLGAKAGS